MIEKYLIQGCYGNYCGPYAKAQKKRHAKKIRKIASKSRIHNLKRK